LDYCAEAGDLIETIRAKTAGNGPDRVTAAMTATAQVLALLGVAQAVRALAERPASQDVHTLVVSLHALGDSWRERRASSGVCASELNAVIGSWSRS
jgi:hypothetical protein